MSPDWAMVWITVVYVMATCAICWANIRSANATKAQLAETKRQFDEENRALVTATFEIIRNGIAALCIENHGKQVAYNVEIRMEQLPYEHVRWIENKDIDVAALSVTSDTKKVKDLHDRPLLLFTHPWSIQTALDRNEGLQLSEFGATEE